MNKVKNRYTTLLLIFSVLTGKLFAQPAGYQGKRILAGYEISLSPNLINPNRNMEYFLNDIHAIYGEYIISKHTSIKASFSSFKTGFSTESANPVFQYDYNVYFYEINKNLLPLLSSRSFEFGPKWYYMHMAPVGFYSNLIIGMRSSAFEDKIVFNEESRIASQFNTDQDPYYNISRVSYEIDKINEFILGVEGGSQRIFFDRIPVKIGLAFRSFWGKGPTVINTIGYPNENMSLEEKLHFDARKRLYNHSVITFNIGIGYLF